MATPKKPTTEPKAETPKAPEPTQPEVAIDLPTGVRSRR